MSYDKTPPKVTRMPISSDMLSTAECIKRYGQPNVDPAKCECYAQLESFEAPFPIRLYARGEKTNVKSIRVHKLVLPFFQAALFRVREFYTPDEIVKYGLDVYGGCYNARPIRGGKDWSKHAFGIAQDWLQQENGLNTPFAKSTFSRPEYKIYLDIFQECGFMNLGRLATYGRDAMHFEAMKTIGVPV